MSTPKLARAEAVIAGWEIFSGLLFVAAVIPEAPTKLLSAFIFLGSLALSGALSKALFQHKPGHLRQFALLALLRALFWVLSALPQGGLADLRVPAAAVFFGSMAGWMRFLFYRRWLEPPPHSLDDPTLRKRLRWMLTETAMIVGIAGGHLLLLFSVAVLRMQSEVIFQAWFEIIPWLAIVGTTGFALAVGPISQNIIIALEHGPNASKDTLQRGLAQAYVLPNKLAYLNFGAWAFCTSLGIVYFTGQKWDTFRWGDTFLQVWFGLLFAFGVSFCQWILHRDTIAPAIFRLKERLERNGGTKVRSRTISLRIRLLREFGLPLLFICTLSLFSSIGLYRALVRGIYTEQDFRAIAALVASFAMLLITSASLVARAARQLSEPMSALAEAANRVAQGHLDEPVPSVSGPVEVVGLGESIERMRARLAKTIGELEKERAGLEANVEARTAELRKALDELRHTQAALIQGERLASIGELMSGVAHEIYNPLTAIAGASAPLEHLAGDIQTMFEAYGNACDNLPENDKNTIKLLKSRLDIDASLEDLTGIAAVIRRATDRSVAIVQNLKNFSRGSGEALPANLQNGVEETLMLLGPRLREASIAIEKQYEKIPQVTCRIGEINQIFMNLFVNAIQSFEQANSSAEQEERPSNPTIYISTFTEMTAAGEMAAVAIEDNGPGIPKALEKRIFDPFFTTKARGQGTGLGLSISTDIAHRHGGSLSLEHPLHSQKGARFVCRIPIEVMNASKP